MPRSIPALARIFVPFTRVGHRLVSRPLLTGLLLISGLLLLVGAALLDARRDAWQGARKASANLVQALERDLTWEMQALDQTLRAVGGLLGEAAANRLDPDLRQALVLDRLSAARYLDAVLVIDAGGMVTFESRTVAISAGLNLADRDYFTAQREADAGFYVSRPYQSRSAGGAWSLGFSRRLSHPDGSFAGVVLGVMRLAHLQAAFAGLQLGQGSAVSLLRRDGIVLVRDPDNERQRGRDIGASPSFRRTQTAPFGQFVGQAVTDGVQRFFTFRQVAGAPLTVSVALAVDTIYAEWWHKVALIGSATLLLAAGMLATLLLLHRELGRRRVMELAAQRSEATFRLLAEHSSDVVTRLDAAGRRVYLSPAAEAVFGRPLGELLGHSAMDHVVPEDRPLLEEALARLRAGERDARLLYRILRPGGQVVWLEASARVVYDAQTGGADGIVAMARDVTERKAAEDRLAALARSDGLTGLANRRAFDEAFAVEWRRARRDGTPLSLLLLDIDRFKLFNDRYGHPEGDACLRRVAGAVAAAVGRPADLVARYGGEEIVVLLPQTPIAGAAILAEKIRAAVEALALPHAANLPGGRVTASIGAGGIIPADTPELTAEALLAAADAALYAAKRGGRNRVVTTEQVPPPMVAPPVPAQEAARGDAVALYRDAAASAAGSAELARIARLAATVLGTPAVLISLVDGERQVFAATYGLVVQDTPREVSFCAHLVASEAPTLVVPDAAADPRFAGNPLVTGGPRLRFYAGAPLICPHSGHRLGALCSIDQQARPPLDPVQQAALSDLAAMAMDALERLRLDGAALAA